MKLPSLTHLLNQLKQVFTRFPLQLVITITAVAVAFILTDAKAENENFLVKLLLGCLLAFTSSLAGYLYAQSRQLTIFVSWLIQGFAVLVSSLIVIWLKPFLWEKDILLLGFFVLCFHLAVSYAAFTRANDVLEFWHFNKTLFLRFLTAALYSLVIMLGLFAALGAIGILFDITIKSSTYLKIAAFAGIGFNTLFFLAGVPDVGKQSHEKGYPKGLKIFTQFVLIPLMTVYLIILFLYEIKIILAWELPKGYVSVLILAYAVFGILSLLLVYPIKNLEENKWIGWFSKFFYLMMLPLLVLLALAIYKRVSDYGITEERYILIVLAIWLTGITFYFLLSKKQTIKIIPLSLSLLCILSAIGPQGAASVSKWSQVNRLQRVLKKGHKDQAAETSSIIRYLTSNHGLVALQPLIQQKTSVIQSSIIKKVTNNNYYQAREQLKDTAFRLLKISELKEGYLSGGYRTFKREQEGVLPVLGYGWVHELEKQTEKIISLEGENLKINTKTENKVLLTVGDQVLSFNIDSVCRAIVGKHKQDPGADIIVPDDEMGIKKEAGGYFFKIVIADFSSDRGETDEKTFIYYKGYLLIGKK